LLYANIRKYGLQAVHCKKKEREAHLKRVKTAGLYASLVNEFVAQFKETRVKMCDTPYCAKLDVSSSLKDAKFHLRKLNRLSKKAQYAAIFACNVGPRSGGGRTGSESTKRGGDALNKIPDIQCKN
jgi:hypothetical protein